MGTAMGTVTCVEREKGRNIQSGAGAAGEGRQRQNGDVAVLLVTV